MIPGLAGIIAAGRGVSLPSQQLPRVATALLPASAGNVAVSVPDWTEAVQGVLTVLAYGTVPGTLRSNAELGIGVCDGAAEFSHSFSARDGLGGGVYQADTNMRTAAATINIQGLVTEASVLGSPAQLGNGSAEYYVSPRNHEGTLIATLWPWPCKAVAVANGAAHTVDMGGDYDLYLFVGTSNTSPDQQRVEPRTSIGACNRGMEQACVGLYARRPDVPTIHSAYVAADKCVASLSNDAPSMTTRSVTAFPAGGISLSAGLPDYMIVLGLQTGGRQVDVRTIVLPTSSGAILTGLPGSPVWTMIVGSVCPALDTLVTTTAWSLGVGITDYVTEAGAACRSQAGASPPSAQSRLAPFLRYDSHSGASLVNISGMTATADGATCTVTSGSAMQALAISVI